MAAKKAVIDTQEIYQVSLGDQVVTALNELRTQLSAGVPVNIPLLALLLPDEPTPGARVLVDAWRSFQVWAVFVDGAWQVDVWQDGKPRIDAD